MGIVLDHNGGKNPLWHNVHPLIVDYLREQGEIANA